jgi:hypothetical protein
MGDNDDFENTHDHPNVFVPTISKTHVQNLKKEMKKALVEKRKKEKRSRNKPPKAHSVPRMPHFFSSQDEHNIKARIDDEGVVEVDTPDCEDDFWDDSFQEDT